MKPTRVAFGLWNGAEDAKTGPGLLQTAYNSGFRTFITSDTLGGGQADRNLGGLLKEVPRDQVCVVAQIGYDSGGGRGHDYSTSRARFTSRPEHEYGAYVEQAVRGVLERLGTDHVDVLLLQDPDRQGFRSRAVWDAFANVKAQGLAQAIGIAPGPANGYTLDLLYAFEQFSGQIDYAMIILGALEPWPGELCLAAAKEKGIGIIAREGSLPAGPGIEALRAARKEKLTALDAIATQHKVGLAKLMAGWTANRPGVLSVAPRLMAEDGVPVDLLLPDVGALETEEVPAELLAEAPKIAQLGSNKGAIALKGGSQQYQGKIQDEQWPIDDELKAVAARHGIALDRDYYARNDARDLRDFGMPRQGVPQAIDRRLYMQLQVFTGVDREKLVHDFQHANFPAVVYADLNDPWGVGVLLWNEDPLALSQLAAKVYGGDGFSGASLKPEFTMIGKTYAFGREDDVEYWLTKRPIEAATLPGRPWAVWYPLRRKSIFYRLPIEEQRDMLREHGVIGHHFGAAGYATDIRLDCFGIDSNDNEFLLGLLSERLDWLSRLVKEMRSTKQTGEYMDSLGPFFTGHVIYASQG